MIKDKASTNWAYVEFKARLEKSSTLREFKIPKLNFDAAEYFDLIDWQNTTVTEPPLTVNVSEADIRLFVATHGDSILLSLIDIRVKLNQLNGA